MHITEIVLAFIEGVALIASPCILPALPLILATSINNSTRRPLGVITGFILAFSLFALLSRELVTVLHLNLDYIKYVSLAFLFSFGSIMLFEPWLNFFARLTQPLAATGTRLSYTSSHNGYLGGVLIGILIGLVWTPCAGPILAAALVQIIRAQNQLGALLLIFAFAIGTGVPMFIIAISSRKLLDRFGFLARHGHIVHKCTGIIIILSAILIASGFNPQYSSPTAKLTTPISNSVYKNQLQNALSSPYQAPEFAPDNIWLNTLTPLTISKLKGKVVLVDFWTYSCINCLRTLPYINAWYQKYHTQGLEIVGVHSPEFEFEKNSNNVLQAITHYEIKYPVALDNSLNTWTNYNNRYWPAHYLINKSGMIVYTNFGEGEYSITENNIRVLLGLNRDNQNSGNDIAFNPTQTPETYLGYARSENFTSQEKVAADQAYIYNAPQELPLNSWALAGKWQIEKDRVISQGPNSKILLNFNARYVYLVLGSSYDKPIRLTIKVNGKALTSTTAGKDVQGNGIATVQNHRLYALVDMGAFSNNLLEIEVPDSGLEAYAFTFGQ